MLDNTHLIKITISPEFKGERLDKVLPTLLTEHTRATIQGWIKSGHILVDKKTPKGKLKIMGNELVEIIVPEAIPLDALPENIPLDIVFEDEQILVLNKPSNLVVHPGAGNLSGTLMNGLLFHDTSLSALPRAGIVHRLDKNTTGLMVVAKSELARQKLIDQLSHRRVSRQYLAIVEGKIIAGCKVNQPIGRHPHDRLRMAVSKDGKEAITHCGVIQKYPHHCLLRLNLETGRTHQIRVHLSWLGYPIVGDKTYGYRAKTSKEYDPSLNEMLQIFPRQALHAEYLSLIHPSTLKPISWQQNPPIDFTKLQSALQLSV